MHFENMEPDDFMKRGYLLPKGCKDLSDEWKQMLRWAIGLDLPHPALGEEPLGATEGIRRLIEEWSKRLADPNLSASERARLERNLKLLRKATGAEDDETPAA